MKQVCKSVSNKYYLLSKQLLPRQQGNSCNIGNAPNLVGKKLKTVMCVLNVYLIWVVQNG